MIRKYKSKTDKPETNPPPVEPQATPKVEPKAEPKVEPQAEPKVEPKAEPKVEPKATPKPKAIPKPKAQPIPDNVCPYSGKTFKNAAGVKVHLRYCKKK